MIVLWGGRNEKNVGSVKVGVVKSVAHGWRERCAKDFCVTLLLSVF